MPKSPVFYLHISGRSLSTDGTICATNSTDLDHSSQRFGYPICARENPHSVPSDGGVSPHCTNSPRAIFIWSGCDFVRRRYSYAHKPQLCIWRFGNIDMFYRSQPICKNTTCSILEFNFRHLITKSQPQVFKSLDRITQDILTLTRRKTLGATTL